MNYSTTVKKQLESLIEKMNRYPWLFVRNPTKDFSRVKKWSFGEMMRFTISIEGGSLKNELLKYFGFSMDTPTNSSFNQRRAQILPEAFEFLFHEFKSVVYKPKLYRGYRLLASDGSDICISYDPLDKSTYFQSTPDSKGFNQMHLNAFFDLLTATYTDAIIQSAREKNENSAMCSMIDRCYRGFKTIFIADRGYENYNIFAHAQENGMYYLIRAKDISSNGIVHSMKAQLPEGQDSFDEMVNITLTRKQTNAVKAEPDKYRVVMKTTAFDYLDLYEHKFYEMKMRILRFPISENSFECIITNLPRDEFPSDTIKELYNLRWGIETSFRELKYTIGLTHFHSKKRDYIKQEIWARLILFNFCHAIITETVPRHVKPNKKHIYQINISRAICICRQFLAAKEKAPPDIESLISRELLPIRTGRSDPRKVKTQSAVSFLYRIA